MLVVSGGVNLGSELGSCVSGRKSRPQNKTLTGTYHEIFLIYLKTKNLLESCGKTTFI